MKKILLILLLATINVGIYAMSDNDSSTPATPVSVFNSQCYHGGAGATACSIAAGIWIDGSVTTACSVSCGAGYYACCGLRCICISSSFSKPDDPKPCVGC